MQLVKNVYHFAGPDSQFCPMDLTDRRRCDRLFIELDKDFFQRTPLLFFDDLLDLLKRVLGRIGLELLQLSGELRPDQVRAGT